MRKLLSNLIVFAMLLVISTSTLSAATAYVEGGTWSYGVTNVVYSNYHHPSRWHSASVINYRGEKARDVQGPGAVARTSLKSGWGSDQAFYDVW
ncbi:MAG: lactococcin 972 family bacteriocin [Mycoplasmatales bacterium]